MKLTLKLILVVCLFSSITFADEGNQGAGGKTCPQGQQTCRPAQELPDTTNNDTNQTDSVLTIIQKYLISIFG